MSKPMIRHCYNCKYYKTTISKGFGVFRQCDVKYTPIGKFPKLRALTCRFYEQKEVKEDE